MTDEMANRIASALERIAAALEEGPSDGFTLFDYIKYASDSLTELNERGIETYERGGE